MRLCENGLMCASDFPKKEIIYSIYRRIERYLRLKLNGLKHYIRIQRETNNVLKLSWSTAL